MSKLDGLVNIAFGIPRNPVLVMEHLSKSSISPFVARNPVWGGILLVASSNAPERATRNLLRPKSNVIELGIYKKGDNDILEKLNSEDGYIRHNGTVIKTNESKIDYIAKLCKQLNVTRAMLHLQNKELISTMKKMHLKVYESLDIYKSLGKKSVFNQALERFSKKHLGSNIGAFGKVFNNLDEAVNEIIELNNYGLRACVKFDETTDKPMLDSGAGVYFLPNFSQSSSKKRIHDYLRQQLKKRNFDRKKLAGVVQIYSPKGTVFSISSGRGENGKYQMYEVHIQTQIEYKLGESSVLTADGATPIEDNNSSSELLNIVWPQLTQFYSDNNISGDQNVNLISLSKKELAIAKKIYDNKNLSSIVPIDLNPRPISGTKRIMGRFSEETQTPINLKNFATRNLHVNPFFAANPHLIFLAAYGLGLRAGIGGNVSFTNFGTLIPEKIRSQRERILIKTYVQNIKNPMETLANLEEIIANKPAYELVKNIKTKKPEEIPDADCDQDYELWLESQLAQVFSRQITSF